MKTHKTYLLAAVLGILALGIALGAMAPTAQADPEPDIYGAPICCGITIPNCFCWPWGDSYPEPPCPTEFEGLPMIEVPAGQTHPAFCAVAP